MQAHLADPRLRTGVRWLTDVALLCATIVVIAKLSGGFATSRAGASPKTDSTFVADWRTIAERGVWKGSRAASVVIVEFGDFECPACRQYAGTIRTVAAEFGTQIAVVFVQWPLEYHRFARMSARSALCANAQGKFWAMHDVLYAQQDSLGLKSWDALATDAGVELSQFHACMLTRAESPAVDSGRAAARRFGAYGTPAVMVNGWYLSKTPSVDEWRLRVRRLLAMEAKSPSTQP